MVSWGRNWELELNGLVRGNGGNGKDNVICVTIAHKI